MAGRPLRQRLQAATSSRRLRRWVIGLVAAIALFGLLGFFAAPALLKNTAQSRLAELLGRPVTIGKVALNPYTLRLDVRDIHVGEPAGSDSFVDVGQLVVDASWRSLLRLRPVVDEVYLDAPKLRVVRTAPQRFNFSDLIEKFAPADDDQPSGPPPRFAVSNIHVDNGSVEFDDQVLGERHTIEQWQLGVPFIANLPSSTPIFVEPMLRATVDGSPLAIDGKVLPFAQSRESEIAFKLDGLELPRLLSYVPARMPVSIPSGKLSADVGIHFAVQEDGQPTLRVSGTADLRELSVVDGTARPLLDADGIHVAAQSIEPLRGVYRLDELRIDRPRANVVRDRSGALNVALGGSGQKDAGGQAASNTPQPAPAPDQGAASPGMANPAPPPASAPAPAAGGIDLSINKLALNDGSVRLRDEASGADLTLGRIAVTLESLSTQAGAPASYTLQAALDKGGELSGSGHVGIAARSFDGDLGIQKLALPALQPFVEPVLAARIAQGTLDVKATVQVQAGGDTPAVRLGPAQIGLDGLQVMPAGAASSTTRARGRARARSQPQALVALAGGTVNIDRVDLSARQAELSAVSLRGLALDVERERDGSINLAKLAQPSAAKPAAASTPTHASAKAAAAPARRAAGPASRSNTKQAASADAPWHYRIGTVALEKSTIRFTDRSLPQPVALTLDALQLKVRNVSEDLRKPLEVELATGYQRGGRLSAKGSVVPSPLKLALSIDGLGLDVAALSPYFADKLNAATLASARVDARGRLALSRAGALQANYQGSVGLNNLRLQDKITADRFAGLRAFTVTGIKASHGPAGTDVSAERVALDDFYARILLDANGRLNLSHFSGDGEAGAASPAGGGAAQDRPADATPPAPAGSAGAAGSSPPLKLRIGSIALSNGKVDYTDNFIRPNFSADLIDIKGTIGGFGTESTEPAKVDVQAMLNGNGPVAIQGTVNPLAKPASLDMTATTRGVELTRFTAYSAKYAGYPIVKGKLNVDLHYKLDNEQLTANNHLFIDQLTFGDRVENDTATKLPVQFAIGLLKNSRGEIDVDIPVSGSLSDPQFSVGGLIWRAVLNLLTRAITAPFSLLANAVGGVGGNADQLGYVEFAPGADTISQAQQAKLETLAKALTDRPALKLDVVGRVDPKLDLPALKQAAVERQIRQQKIRDLGRRAANGDQPVVVAPEEREKYLARAYAAADFDKPRNFIGMAKSLPAAEMEAALLAHAQAGEPELAALAQRRGTAVQRWFEGKVDAGRIYAVAPRLDADGIKDGGATTRVEFVLK
ncbi:DUF748 domain-containing protein [Pigmentiphaga soli]|uniref:DUF748 domain-containing protein n=2 Tax=Pigmentiphaga soli TaxID=1007095 RepID=A0ABP8HDQ5_9BURK